LKTVETRREKGPRKYETLQSTYTKSAFHKGFYTRTVHLASAELVLLPSTSHTRTVKEEGNKCLQRKKAAREITWPTAESQRYRQHAQAHPGGEGRTVHEGGRWSTFVRPCVWCLCLAEEVSPESSSVQSSSVQFSSVKSLC
jgi:hypothetical protein